MLVQNTNVSSFLLRDCSGATKLHEKLKVENPAGPGESILLGAAPFGAPRRQANPLGMIHS
jgi:hypothetical protein